MRKLAGILALTLALMSCSKDFVTGQFEEELNKDIEEIKAYLTANNLDYEQDSNTGVFWKITKPNPAGDSPNSLNMVYSAWKISKIDGEELFKVTAQDSSIISYTNANGLFPGFVLALNSLREGEAGTFYIPSPYAFADSPPTNFTGLNKWDPIRFDVEVIRTFSEDEYIAFFISRNGLRAPELTDQNVRIIRLADERPQTADLVNGNNVTLKYKGYFLDKAKTKFDEGQFSYTIGSGGLIVGFDNALTKMRVGEKITAIIPAEKAYGAQGSGSIPPYTPIAFDIEIVSKN